jgi:phage shock protein B
VRIDPILIPILAILCVFVITPWMAFRHEERKRELRARESMSAEDAEQFHRTVARLEARMKVLESILDDEVPGWRRKLDE